MAVGVYQFLRKEIWWLRTHTTYTYASTSYEETYACDVFTEPSFSGTGNCDTSEGSKWS